jgi:DNA repair protein RecN (Recombination protein N)
MLTELAIRDLALIERASLVCGAGLNVVTGETGAGKSLLIDALELLLGERARAGLVRAGASEARVEGRFVLAGDGYGAEVARWLEEELPEALEEGREENGQIELILSRTLARDGRSRAHVNHRPVTSRLLRELAALLVEIHGQNDHQRLLDRGEQRRLLDSYGEHGAALAGYRERRARWIELADRLAAHDTSESERLERLDLLRFQAAELDAAAPAAGERAALEGERELLRHAEAIARTLGGALRALAEDEGSALEIVEGNARTVESWAARIEALAVTADSLRSAVAHIQDACAGLRSVASGAEADPARLDALEERLGELARLEKKHRTDCAGLVLRRAEIEAEIEALGNTELGHEELARAVEQARAAVLEAAQRLGEQRRATGERLAEAVRAGLGDLGLARAHFDAGVTPRAPVAPGLEDDLEEVRKYLGPDGTEDVEFVLAANPGEMPAPLRKVASGGEVARIMLALRGALAVRQSTPTLVFDEVDAGVGGRLGPQVAGHLRRLAAHHQVLCVTHLPAIAASAHRHLRVRKETEGERTRTQVAELAGDDRVEEVADMIAGGAKQETARAEARRLIEDCAGTRPRRQKRAR